MQNKAILGGAAALAVLAAGGWWALRTPATISVEPASGARAPAMANGLLVVDPAKAAALGIATAPARAADQVPLADLPATIAPPANARVAVAATLPGTVLRTMVVEGDAVARGQALAVIASRDVMTLSADLARAHARAGVAQSSAARLAQLSREGIIAGARADEARAQAAEAGADVSEKARILGLVGARGGNGTYTLTAPIAGRVTKADIQAGMPVDGMTAPFVIDAAGRYEATAQVPERLIGQIRVGQTVRLPVANGSVSGTVIAVGSAIDPATRSATLKAQLPADPGIIAGRVGSLTVWGSVPAPGGSGAVTVPAGALTMIGADEVVFVATPKGYQRRTVHRLGAGDGQVVLKDGVRAGEAVVVSGTSALKALAEAN
jgi:cobalt-zinc-cadmium efflux system membrane fusion protein